MNSGVYEIVNRENGKRYVGSACDIEGRFSVHRHSLRRGKHHSRYLQRAWDKQGEATFMFRPLLFCSRRHLVFYEQLAFDGLKPEYNCSPTAGNALGVKWSDEARARCSARQKANPNMLGRHHSLETLARMSLAKMGNTATKGKKRNPEAVAKTAAAHRGMKRSAETRQRISIAMTGKSLPKSPETRAKLSAALRGRSTLTLEATARMAATKRGTKLSEEHKAKIGASSRLMWARRKAERC